jgi:lipoate-protein ligase A
MKGNEMPEYIIPEIERILPFKQYKSKELAAITELLPEWVDENKAPSTLLLGEFGSYTLTLPRFQSLEDVDIKKCENYGVEIVRVGGGGRAVFHTGKELYFMVVYRDEESINVTKHYKAVCESLSKAFKLVGIEAEPYRRTFTIKEGKKVEGWDIKIGDSADSYWSNKIAVLSAINLKNAVMRHGAIFYEPYTREDFERMLELMNPPDDLDIDGAIEMMSRFCTSVKEYGDITKEELYKAIVKCFSPNGKIEDFTSDELEQIRDAARRQEGSLKIENSRRLGLCILPWGFVPEWDVGAPLYPKKSSISNI